MELNEERCALYIEKMLEVAGSQEEEPDFFDCDVIRDVILGGSCTGIGCDECGEKVVAWLKTKQKPEEEEKELPELPTGLNERRCAEYVKWLLDKKIGIVCDFSKKAVLGTPDSCDGVTCEECRVKAYKWFRQLETPAKAKAKSGSKEFYAMMLLKRMAYRDEEGLSIGNVGCRLIQEHVLGTPENCSDVSCADCRARVKEWYNSLDSGELPEAEEATPEVPEAKPAQSRLAVFLDQHPHARLAKQGVPSACVRDIFGVDAQPKCTGLTCRECWSVQFEQVEE